MADDEQVVFHVEGPRVEFDVDEADEQWRKDVVQRQNRPLRMALIAVVAAWLSIIALCWVLHYLEV